MIPIIAPVLLYHSIARPGRTPNDRWQVSAADFAADMEAVAASGRACFTATGYLRWLRDDLPHRPDPVLVTFDDGFADFADVALPILQSLNLPSTLFVTTAYLDRPKMLSGTALRDVASAGVEIGGHSVTHPHLDLLPEDAAGRELRDCRVLLEDLIGRPVNSFAYPHGSQHAGTRTLTAQAGYTTAHAVKNALSHSGDDPMGVARYTVTADTTRRQVGAVLAGTGAPLAWRRERLRTRVYRLVRRRRSPSQNALPFPGQALDSHGSGEGRWHGSDQ